MKKYKVTACSFPPGVIWDGLKVELRTINLFQGGTMTLSCVNEAGDCECSKIDFWITVNRCGQEEKFNCLLDSEHGEYDIGYGVYARADTYVSGIDGTMATWFFYQERPSPTKIKQLPFKALTLKEACKRKYKKRF